MEVNVAQIGLALLIILISMTLHEAMHAFAGFWLGDDTARREGRLTLNPIAHIDPFLTIALPLMLAIFGLPIFGGAKPVPFNPHAVRYGDYGAAIVGLAGPLTNLLIAFICVALAAFTADGVASIFIYAAAINIGFFVFNMLPLPPLDGSRVLYAFAPETVRRGMEFIESRGLIPVFIIILLFSAQIGQFMGVAITGIINFLGRIFGLQIV